MQGTAGSLQLGSMGGGAGAMEQPLLPPRISGQRQLSGPAPLPEAEQLMKDMQVLNQHPDRSTNFARGLSATDVTLRQ